MNNNMPLSIKQAANAIWIILAVDVSVGLISKLAGLHSEGEFAGNLIFNALLCIIPYKLMNGSNPARYIWLILTIMAYVAMIGLPGSTHLEILVSIIMIPLQIFIIRRLFQKDSAHWFEKTN